MLYWYDVEIITGYACLGGHDRQNADSRQMIDRCPHSIHFTMALLLNQAHSQLTPNPITQGK